VIADSGLHGTSARNVVHRSWLQKEIADRFRTHSIIATTDWRVPGLIASRFRYEVAH
jgi:hypothetical protein